MIQSEMLGGHSSSKSRLSIIRCYWSARIVLNWLGPILKYKCDMPPDVFNTTERIPKGNEVPFFLHNQVRCYCNRCVVADISCNCKACSLDAREVVPPDTAPAQQTFLTSRMTPRIQKGDGAGQRSLFIVQKFLYRKNKSVPSAAFIRSSIPQSSQCMRFRCLI